MLTAPLLSGKTPCYECPGYDIKPSHGEAQVLWGMESLFNLAIGLMSCLTLVQETGIQSSVSHTKDSKNDAWCHLA